MVILVRVSCEKSKFSNFVEIIRILVFIFVYIFFDFSSLGMDSGVVMCPGSDYGFDGPSRKLGGQKMLGSLWYWF